MVRPRGVFERTSHQDRGAHQVQAWQRARISLGTNEQAAAGVPRAVRHCVRACGEFPQVREYREIEDGSARLEKARSVHDEYVPEGSAARGWKRESDLPPEDLEEFQQVWDPGAPRRCRECGKALRGCENWG